MRVMPHVFAYIVQILPMRWVPAVCFVFVGLTLALLVYYCGKARQRMLRKIVELSVRLAIETTIEHEKEIEGYRLEYHRHTDSPTHGPSEQEIALTRRFESSSALDIAIHELVELELGNLRL